ncbi:MAG: TonB-dependent receptor plug domain-containing protein [Bacteroidia bacterium]|nr:TonB-dependent receptor plug domain-containing protein [Bacteroidia bacterium]
MKIFWRILFLFTALLPFKLSHAQYSTVKGRVIDQLAVPIEGAKLRVIGFENTSLTNKEGNYSLQLIAGVRVRIEISKEGYQKAILALNPVDGRIYNETIKLLDIVKLENVDIVGEKDPTSINDRDAMLVSPISLDKASEIPIVAPSVEGLAKYQPGVVSNNEFSSQYQVRGGNFDENLVYVNGIEIYRPFLARAGQQEGLGFSNPSMAQGLKFSTGGFGAQYGDKLSSVLDITYRNPKSFRATAELGVVTNNFHVEGRSKNKKNPEQPGRFSYLMGARRFSLGYFLNSLERQGSYSPNFLDFQGMFTFTPNFNPKEAKIRTRRDGTRDTVYYPNERVKWTAFVALTRNRYQSVPQSQETTVGTFSDPFRLFVGFSGLELSTYNTGLGALSLEHKPNTRLQFQYTLTGFQTYENEFIDLFSGYRIGAVNTNLGSDEFGESEFDDDIGADYIHARNSLQASVLSFQAKGRWIFGRKLQHRLLFGTKVQYQNINDRIKEYTLTDSANFVIDFAGNFDVQESVRATGELEGFTYKTYLQHQWDITPKLLWTWGTRAVHYTINDQWFFSPRAELLIKAKQDEDGETKLRFRFAGGIYHQPPFYREFRRFDGSLNLDNPAQRSIHAIAGAEYRFFLWNRPFVLFSEAYYKYLDRIIPYEIQSIRIRYYPDSVANGYAQGLDFRVNGEFIKGVDSWVSIGLLRTEEQPGNDPERRVFRPTDQRFTFSMYFQDELPNNPTFKAHISYFFGSGLRHGPPRIFELRTWRRFPIYQRVDIGFSKLISFKRKEENEGKRGIESIWTTLELYNVFQYPNTGSFIWVSDLNNNRYAIPNRLSDRLINLRVVMKFH